LLSCSFLVFLSRESRFSSVFFFLSLAIDISRFLSPSGKHKAKRKSRELTAGSCLGPGVPSQSVFFLPTFQSLIFAFYI
jgi:hypothetical protein